MRKTAKKLLVLFFSLIILFVSISQTVFAETADSAEEPEKNGDVYILFTSDIHAGIEKGFGLASLWEIRESLEAQGYTVLLVDDGDAVQGEALTTLTKGEGMIDVMNAMGYDAAIPGNHEFDYGVDRLMYLAEIAEYPYLSCNITKDGELVFEPYKIFDAAGMKIAFIGITTPTTFSSTSQDTFHDEDGNLIYGFCQGEDGALLYEAVQQAVDAARAEGADYVYAIAHLGNELQCEPYTYADVIANTIGIDVMLDGHSHDTDQIVMKNKDGQDVVRSAVGTKLECIGYSHISAEEGITETGIWRWENPVPASELFGFDNEISKVIAEKDAEMEDLLTTVIGFSEVRLTIYDPEAVTDDGRPVRMVRRAETNFGDFLSDAVRMETGADIGLMNGGGIRVNVEPGEITYKNVLDVLPFGNGICLMEVTGQQILDLLEWGAKDLPGESGGFQHVSGMTFEIDLSVESTCTMDDTGDFTGVTGDRRVKNAMVNGEPLDPEKTYTLAGSDHTLLNGSASGIFKDALIIEESVKLDSQCMIDYIEDTLGGVIGAQYEDPYGEGRILIIEAPSP